MSTTEIEAILKVHGESVTYQPSGGAPRNILAVPNRQPPSALTGAPHGTAPMSTWVVANNAITGISSAELNTGGDKLNIAVNLGETPQGRSIVRIISQDADGMEILVR